jgi:hypothetical protein
MSIKGIGMMFLNVLLVIVVMYVIKMIAVKTNLGFISNIMPSYANY